MDTVMRPRSTLIRRVSPPVGNARSSQSPEWGATNESRCAVPIPALRLQASPTVHKAIAGEHSILLQPRPQRMSPPLETKPQRKYAKRMRRLKHQTQELIDLGLVSTRKAHIDLESSPRPNRVTTAEFWGEKAKMRLIKQLGCTEAYRDIEVRKAIHRDDGGYCRLSANSTPVRQCSASLLRRSCPTSPTAIDALPKLVKTSSVHNTRRIGSIHKIIDDCEQLLSDTLKSRPAIS